MIKADSDRFLDPQYRISTLTFELNFEFQYWQLCSMLKRSVNVESIEKFLSVQHWAELSILKFKIELKFQCWGSKTLKACQNQSLINFLCRPQIKFGPLYNKGHNYWKSLSTWKIHLNWIVPYYKSNITFEQSMLIFLPYLKPFLMKRLILNFSFFAAYFAPSFNE